MICHFSDEEIGKPVRKLTTGGRLPSTQIQLLFVAKSATNCRLPRESGLWPASAIAQSREVARATAPGARLRQHAQDGRELQLKPVKSFIERMPKAELHLHL